MFLLWTAPIGLLLLIIVSFFDGCYNSLRGDSLPSVGWSLRRILIPCGGNPSVACGHPFGNVPYGQPPLSGEARPKSRLRRLAVGGCWRSPLEGRLAGFGWCLPEERALRGNPSVACGRHLPFQGRHGLRAAFGGWP